MTFPQTGNAQRLPELRKLYWYTATQHPPADKVAGGLYGYEEAPSYETIERYDLRFIAHETWDEVTSRYF